MTPSVCMVAEDVHQDYLGRVHVIAGWTEILGSTAPHHIRHCVLLLVLQMSPEDIGVPMPITARWVDPEGKVILQDQPESPFLYQPIDASVMVATIMYRFRDLVLPVPGPYRCELTLGTTAFSLPISFRVIGP